MKTNVSMTVVFMMIANFFVKFFGLLREILIAKYYGTSFFTDAYIIANNIPTVLFASIGSAIATTFIPMYSKICSKEGKQRADIFTMHFIEILLAICLVITLFGELFTEKLVCIFALGFKDEVLGITINFTKILFPSIFGMALFNLFGSYLQQYEEYKAVALVPIIGNVTIIISLIVSDYFSNIYFFVWGTLIGLMAQVLFYLPWVIKWGIFKGKIGGLKDDIYLHELLPLLIPVFIGVAATEINSIVDRTLVSGMKTGSVAALNYSYKIVNLIMGVVVASVITVMYPKIAKSYELSAKTLFNKICDTTVMSMYAIIVPFSLMVIIFRNEIIIFLFKRGSFDENSVAMTASALAFYSMGLAAMGLREIFVRIFYSTHNTKIPVINGVISTIINIILDLCLIKLLSHNGAALATSVSAVIGATLLLRKLIVDKFISWKLVIVSFIKSSVSALVAFGIVISIYNYYICRLIFETKKFIVCILSLLVFVVIYIVMQVVLKNEIIMSLYQKIKINKSHIEEKH